MFVRIVPLLALLALAACSDSPPSAADSDAGAADDGATSDFRCGPNLTSVGPACVPTFSDCNDRDEVPVPGGGCKRVGVRACQEADGVPGIEAPPQWQCTRVGAHECTTGAGGPGLRSAPDWVCRAVGPPLPCLPGWRVGKDRWCEPPAREIHCGSAAMKMIGHSSCQPVGDCGSGRWGKLTRSSETIHVDGAHVGPQDGSAAAPFRTIGRALRAAPRHARGHIVVAAGRYVERLVVDRPVVIEGRCAAQVSVIGVASDRPAVEVSARDVALSGLTVTGRASGIRVDGRASATLDAVVVRDCEGEGIGVEPQASLTLRRSLLRRNRGFGVVARSGTLTVEACMVSDTRAELQSRALGVGVAAVAVDKRGPPALTVRRSVIARNRTVGVLFEDGVLLVEQSIIADTREQALDRYNGWGIYAAMHERRGGRAVIRDSSVLRSRGAGMVFALPQVRLERVIVADTGRHVSDGSNGNGVFVGDPRDSPDNRLELRNTIVARNHNVGLWVYGSLDGAGFVVRDTQPLPGSYTGEGVVLIEAKTATITDATLRDNANRGLYSWDSTVTLTRALIEGTRAPNARTRVAFGVQAWRTSPAEQVTPPDIEVRDSLLRDNPVGVALQGARGRVLRSAMIDAGLNGARVRAYGQSSGRLELEDCLVSGARLQGVQIRHADGSVLRSVVRDARAEPGVFGGVGVAAYGDDEHRPTVQLDQTLVTNVQSGVDIQTADVTMRRSAVQYTKTAASTVLAGYCVRLVNGAPSLTLSDSRIAHCVHRGIEAVGARLVVVGSEIRSVVATDHASGVFVAPQDGRASQLQVHDSAVIDVGGLGIISRASYATVERTLIRDIRKTPSGDYGLAVGADDQSFDGGVASKTAGSLTLDRVMVERAASVGVGYVRTGGSLQRSLVRDSGLSVYLGSGAAPRIERSNRFIDNQEDRISFGRALELPGPAPLPPKP